MNDTLNCSTTPLQTVVVVNLKIEQTSYKENPKVSIAKYRFVSKLAKV
jgi:hypothetical protein